jgi:hypothetical protein
MNDTRYRIKNELTPFVEPTMSAARALLAFEGYRPNPLTPGITPGKERTRFQLTPYGLKQRPACPALITKWKREGGGSGKIMRLSFNQQREALSTQKGKQQRYSKPRIVPVFEIIDSSIPRVFAVVPRVASSAPENKMKREQGTKGPAMEHETPPKRCHGSEGRMNMAPRKLFGVGDESALLLSPPRNGTTGSGSSTLTPWSAKNTPQRVFSSFLNEKNASEKVPLTPLSPPPENFFLSPSSKNAALLLDAAAKLQGDEESSPLSFPNLPRLPSTFAARLAKRHGIHRSFRDSSDNGSTFPMGLTKPTV